MKNILKIGKYVEPLISSVLFLFYEIVDDNKH